MRQIRIKNKWVNGMPTEAGQRYRYTDGAGNWQYGTYQPDGDSATDLRITKRAFLAYRLTEAEYIRIDLASQGSTEDSAKVRRFMEMFRTSACFDLGLDSNINDLRHIEEMGLLDGEGRADEILSTPVTEIERYRG
jgi:hypothetical protein